MILVPLELIVHIAYSNWKSKTFFLSTHSQYFFCFCYYFNFIACLICSKLLCGLLFFLFYTSIHFQFYFFAWDMQTANYKPSEWIVYWYWENRRWNHFWMFEETKNRIYIVSNWRRRIHYLFLYSSSLLCFFYFFSKAIFQKTTDFFLLPFWLNRIDVKISKLFDFTESSSTILQKIDFQFNRSKNI